MLILRIEEEILEPQSLASAAIKYLNFPLVFRNYAFLYIGILGDYTLLLIFI